MDATGAGDIINPVAISSYFQAMLPNHLVFAASGAAVVDFDALAQSGGDTITVKRFAEDTTADEINGGVTSTAGALTSVSDIGVVCHRKRVRGVDDVVKALLGTGDADAVNREIARQNTNYWTAKSEKAMVSVLKGLFDDTTGILKDTHRNKTAAAASFDDIVDTMSLLGDNMEDLRLMIAHSKAWADLLKETGGKANYLPIGPGGELAPTYMGRRVLLTEQYGVTVSDHYPIFLCRPASLFFAYQRQMQIYYQLNALVPTEIITSTLDFVPHVYGTKWGGTPANAGGPTNTELEVAASWTKANSAQDKEIGIVQLLCVPGA